MKISQRSVVAILSEEGRQVLQMAAAGLWDASTAPLYVQDTDDLGMWVRINREDGEHSLLVRWEFILAVDILLGETKIVGLKP